MKHCSGILSIYKNFSAMIHTYFDTSIHVFRANSAGEYLSNALRQVLAEQGTLAQFFVLVLILRMGLLSARIIIYEITRALMITSSVPPHFWVEVISIATYLINIQPSSTLQGGIPFKHHYGKMPGYSSLHLFCCVCYVLLAPRERTKLTAQSIECVFLGYSAEYKGYRYWDLVARRMWTSRGCL
jgi:hypothetical protein